jgi:hypothetical protein
MMRGAMVLAGILVFGVLATARAADKEKVEPWQFKALKGDKVTGRYDFSVVARESGVFASSMSYGGAKALGKKSPGRPEVRAYAELDAKGHLGRFKRWKARGKAALYWMAFLYEGKAKIRFEQEDGKHGKVTEVGEALEVVPLEADQPFLAWLLVRGLVEREVACMGTASVTLGKARVVREGSVDGADVWKVSGDCGTFTIALDAAGEPRVIKADGYSWERVAPQG